MGYKRDAVEQKLVSSVVRSDCEPRTAEEAEKSIDTDEGP